MFYPQFDTLYLYTQFCSDYQAAKIRMWSECALNNTFEFVLNYWITLLHNIVQYPIKKIKKIVQNPPKKFKKLFSTPQDIICQNVQPQLFHLQSTGEDKLSEALGRILINWTKHLNLYWIRKNSNKLNKTLEFILT